MRSAGDQQSRCSQIDATDEHAAGRGHSLKHLALYPPTTILVKNPDSTIIAFRKQKAPLP